ncbi:hypothetical protein T10_6436 [Trichinella papuae]|uniref:Uncharacterized protein n=1 Tax=Trichinella papuae TaxID=268474 RepID=A0A0V1LZD2_9BILA|nr:hypothetical protein T10_6436 [Trichinella papuae]
MKSRKGSLLYQYIFKYILVFASGNNIRLLATSKSWSMVDKLVPAL